MLRQAKLFFTEELKSHLLEGGDTEAAVKPKGLSGSSLRKK